MSKNHWQFGAFAIVLVVMLLFWPAVTSAETNYSLFMEAAGYQAVDQPARAASNEGFSGRLRIYIVEPFSRYTDNSGAHYDYGFLDFAYNADISINYLDTLCDTVTFNGSGWNNPNLTEGNIMAIAVVFAEEGVRSFSVPPDSFPFSAYYVQATAAATTTEQWSNETSEPGFTHTVFVEEGTRDG
ncbi:MAG: hypothetical protein JW763_02490 [candidate division Zixibacteria bacterium]|nr:hypothetical protein [candidate division Zixibacteria bacterium]